MTRIPSEIRRPVSSSGGISNAIDRGLAIGCESLQVFTHNPRTWAPINHKDEEIRRLPCQVSGAGMGPLVSHGLYLINLGAPTRSNRPASGKPPQDTQLLRSSQESLRQHLAIGEALWARRRGAARGLVQGHDVRRGGRPDRLGHRCGVRRGPRRVLRLPREHRRRGRHDRPDLRAAQGRVRRRRPSHPPGLLLDTQHLYASGYPVHEVDGIDRVLDEFDRVVGLEQLRCLHLNDSMTDFGANRDRHENIGDGQIGEDGFRRILGHPALQALRASSRCRAWRATAPTRRTWTASAACTGRAWSCGGRSPDRYEVGMRPSENGG